MLKKYDIKFGLIFGGCLFAAGLVLQLLCGPIAWRLLACPVNFIVLGVWLVAFLLLHIFCSKKPFVRWLSDMTCATSSLIWCAAATVLMGLLRQRGGDGASWPGFHAMTSHWSFFLMYFWLCTSVLMTLFRLSLPLAFSAKKIAFLSSHIGILTMLVAGTLGGADFSEVKLQVEKGQTVWAEGVGIELLDFESETYDDGTARAYRSIVEIHLPDAAAPDNASNRAVIEVNKPYTVAGMKIYQSGYDQKDGRYSILQVVRDPWLPAFFIGLSLTLLGAFLRFFRRTPRTE